MTEHDTNDHIFIGVAIIISLSIIAFTCGYNWRSTCEDRAAWRELNRFQAEAVSNGSGYWLRPGTRWYPSDEFRWGKAPATIETKNGEAP